MAVDLKLDSAGIRDLLRSDGVLADLRARAGRVAERAGPGMAVDADARGSRASARVWTDTFEAMHAEASERRLTRAFDAAR